MWFYFLWPHLHPFWNQRMGKILLTNTINKDNRNSLRYRRYPLLSLRRVQKSVRKARDVRSPRKGTLPQPVSRPEWWPIKRRIAPLLLMQARHVKRPTDDPSYQWTILPLRCKLKRNFPFNATAKGTCRVWTR